jgi:hypothetical protein
MLFSFFDWATAFGHVQLLDDLDADGTGELPIFE